MGQRITRMRAKAIMGILSSSKSAVNLAVKTRIAGEEWTAVTDSPFSFTDTRDVAYGGGRWVAVGNSG